MREIPQHQTYLKEFFVENQLSDHVIEEGLSEDNEVQNLVLFTKTGDSSTYKEAIESSKWKTVMEYEIQAIDKNKTWDITKWIYKTKLNERGEVHKYKARLVALGYAHKHEIDYTEVFAPMARWDTIRMILALATLHN